MAGGVDSPSNSDGKEPGLQNMPGGQAQNLIGDITLLNLKEALDWTENSFPFDETNVWLA